MEITEKVRDMIMSKDTELHSLVNAIINEYTTFTYTFQGVTKNIGVHKGTQNNAKREVLRYQIRAIELLNSKLKN